MMMIYIYGIIIQDLKTLSIGSPFCSYASIKYYCFYHYRPVSFPIIVRVMPLSRYHFPAAEEGGFFYEGAQRSDKFSKALGKSKICDTDAALLV